MNAQQKFEITRKTKTHVRFKPYGATNRAASRTLSGEVFDRLYEIIEPGICVERGKTLVQLSLEGKL